MSRRYWIDPLPPPGDGLLTAEVSRHLRVMRVRPGTTVALFDGRGSEVEAEVVAGGGRGAIAVRVGTARKVEREPDCRVEIAFAAPKGGRADWLIEHGTEVGVAGFRPVRFARARGEAGAGRRARWQRISVAAAEQCDRSRVPALHDEVDLAGLLAQTVDLAQRWVAVPGARTTLVTATAPALLVVGPEGGFTDEEIARMIESGCTPCSLGPLTLRVETAALVGAARLLG